MIHLIAIAAIVVVTIMVASADKPKSQNILAKKGSSIISSPTHTTTPAEKNTPTPTKITSIQTEPSKQKAENTQTGLLKYPNAIQTSSSGNTLSLESQDDPDAITQWYKEKIQSLGMNSKSFVTTKTNGNILNKLVGANGTREVQVEITKQNDESTVHITITDKTSIDNQNSI